MQTFYGFYFATVLSYDLRDTGNVAIKQDKVWLVRTAGGRESEGKIDRGRREREMECKAKNIKAFSSLCALIFIWNQLVPNHEDNTKPSF